MKKWILALFALVFFAGYVIAQSGDSTGKSVSEKITLQRLTFNTEVGPAFIAAEREGKPVFVYARSEDCGYCRKFEAETFTNETAINLLKNNFILVSIDIYKQRSERINFRVYGTPTMIFLDNDGIEKGRIPGYIETQPFIDTVNKILQ